MKLLKFGVMGLALMAQQSMAFDFELSRPSTTSSFKQKAVLADGTKVFEVTTKFHGQPGTAVDRYTVNCKARQIVVSWGPTTGGANGNVVPGGGSAVSTNKSDNDPIFAAACRE